MADGTPDTGDPFAGQPTWWGRFEVAPATGTTTTNATVMLSKSNEVQFCGDYTCTTTSVGTLPEECRPKAQMVFPVWADTGIHTLTIKPDGTILTGLAGLVHLNGFSFHINDNWY